MNPLEILSERFPRLAQKLMNIVPPYVTFSMPPLTKKDEEAFRLFLNVIEDDRIEAITEGVIKLTDKFSEAVDEFLSILKPEEIVMFGKAMMSVGSKLKRENTN